MPRTRLSPDFSFALRGKLLMERPRGLGERLRAWLAPTFPRTALAGAVALILLAGVLLTANVPRRPPPQEAARMDASAGEIPSHYVLERIPATPKGGVPISSSVYKSRGDSLSASRGTHTAQVVRF
jgi:hypothetical protein